jgi:hypothetical protein
MRVVGERFGATLLAALLAAGVQPAHAQSPSDFRLPPSTSTPAPRVQGPVDPDNPVITSPRPTPRPTPTPTPAQTATPQPTATAAPPRPGATAVPRPGTTRPAVAPLGQGSTPQPISPSATGPAALPPAPGSSASASTAPIFSTVPQQGPAPTLAPAESGWPSWLPIAGGVLALLLAAAGGLVWWRRRQEVAPVEIEFERPVVSAAPPAASASPVAIPEPQLAAAPELAAQPAVKQDGLALTLDARRMSASLMATTLSYRLTLTNHSDAPMAALAIEGDMIAAHGSLPPEQQVASRTQKLELRHALVELAPGESAEFTGDIRVPLNMITPIRAGEAAYFIPLARFRVEAGDLVLAQTFVVGEQPADPTAALRPFRLDLGPRTYSQIGQRAL